MSANTAAEYDSILNTMMDTVEAPPLVPVGTWTLKVLSASFKEADNAEDPDVILFGYDPQSAEEDVDPDEVATGDYKGQKLWQRFQIGKDSRKSDLFKVRTHIEKHGVEMEGRTLGQALDVLNKTKPSVRALVGVRTYTNAVGQVITTNTTRNFSSIEE